MNFSVCNGQCLDEDIRLIIGSDGKFIKSTLSLQSQDLRLRTESIHRADKQQDSTVDVIRVDLDSGCLTGGVFPLIGNQFQVIKAIVRATIVGATHEQHRSAFLLMSFGVRKSHAETELAGLWNSKFQTSGSCCIGRGIPRLHFLFNRFVAAIVVNGEQANLTLADDRFAIGGTCLKSELNCVVRLIVALIRPCEDAEWFASHQYAA